MAVMWWMPSSFIAPETIRRRTTRSQNRSTSSSTATRAFAGRPRRAAQVDDGRAARPAALELDRDERVLARASRRGPRPARRRTDRAPAARRGRARSRRSAAKNASQPATASPSPPPTARRAAPRTSGVASAWWVRLRPTMVNGTPAARTRSTASGSTPALNSAAGVTLPHRRRAAHPDDLPQPPGEVGLGVERERDVGQRARGDQRERAAASAAAASSASAGRGRAGRSAPGARRRRARSPRGCRAPSRARRRAGRAARRRPGCRSRPASVRTRSALSVTRSSGPLPAPW